MKRSGAEQGKKIFLLALLLASLQGCNNESGEIRQNEVEYNSYLDQAAFYLDQGQLKASLIEARNASRIFPDRAAPLILNIETLLTAGDGKQALSQVEALKNPRFELTAAQKTHIDYLQARAFYLQNEPESAKPLLGGIITLSEHPLQGKALILRGQIETDQNQLAEAANTFEAATEISAVKAEALTGLSRISWIDGKQADAEALIQAALEADPNNTASWVWRGRMNQKLERYEQAETAYMQALEDIGGSDVMTREKYALLSDLVEVLRKQNKFHEALTYSGILTRSPQGIVKEGFDSAARFYRAGNREEAAATLEQVLADVPGHNKSGLFLGVIRYEQGDLEAAEALLAKHLTEDTPLQIQKLLGLIRMKLDHSQQAAIDLGKLTEKEDDPDLLILFGLASLASGATSQGTDSLATALDATPGDTALRSRVAVLYARSGSISLAQDILDDAPAPSEDLAITQAWIFASTHQIEAAQSALEPWITGNGPSAAALSAAGTLAYFDGDRPIAKAYFLKALDRSESHITALSNLANIARQEEDWDAAYRYAQKALAIAPDHPGVIPNLIHAAEHLDKLDAVEGSLQVALNDPAGSSAEARKLIQHGLIQVSEIQGNHDRVMDQVLRAAGQLPAKQHQQLLEETVNRSVRLALRERNLLLAEKRLEPLKNAPLPSPVADVLEAEIALARNDEERAIELLNQASARHAQSSLADRRLGALYRDSGRMEKALVAYQTGWKKEKTNQLALDYYRALVVQGDLSSARELLRDWQSSQPDNLVALKMSGMHEQQHGDSRQAISYYEAVLKDQPYDPATLNNLAWLYFEQKDGRARDIARQAYNLRPKDPAILDTYGWILLNAGETQQAIRLLEAANAGDPDSEEIISHLNAAREQTINNQQH